MRGHIIRKSDLINWMLLPKTCQRMQNAPFWQYFPAMILSAIDSLEEKKNQFKMTNDVSIKNANVCKTSVL